MSGATWGKSSKDTQQGHAQARTQQSLVPKATLWSPALCCFPNGKQGPPAPCPCVHLQLALPRRGGALHPCNNAHYSLLPGFPGLPVIKPLELPLGLGWHHCIIKVTVMPNFMHQTKVPCLNLSPKLSLRKTELPLVIKEDGLTWLNESKAGPKWQERRPTVSS